MAALAAIVFSSAVPIAPPSCCPVLTLAEAIPRVAWRHAEGTGVGRRREYETTAETGHDERPEQSRHVTRVHADPGEPDHAGRVEQQANGD